MADPRIRIRATDETGPAFRTASSNLAAMQANALRLGTVLGGAFAVAGGALAALVSGSINAADELGKLSERAGVAVETMGGLAFSADLAGVSLDQIGTATDKLNRTLAEAAGGTKQSQEAFKLLGIAVVDVSGKTRAVDTVMADVADRFEKFADGPEKTALAVRLFGKAGAELIPLLNGGGAAIRENTEYYRRFSGMTEELSQRSEVFNDTLTKVKLVSGSLGNNLANALLPTLQAVADELLRAQEQGTGFVGVGKKIGDAFNFIADKAAYGVLAFRSWIIWFTGLKDIATSPLNAPTTIGRIRDELVAAYDDMRRFQRTLESIGNGRRNANDPRRLDFGQDKRSPAPCLTVTTPTPSTRTTNPVSELDLLNKELFRYAERLQDAIDRTGDLSAAEEALIFIRRKGADESSAEVQRILNLARQIDETKRLVGEKEALLEIDRAIADQEKRLADQRQAAQDALDDQINELSGRAEADRKRALVERLEAQLNAGAAFSPEELDRIVRGIGGVNEQITASKTLADDLGLTFTSAFEDAIVGGKKFSDVLKGLEQDILRIVTRKLVTEPLSKAITGILGPHAGAGPSSGGGFGGFLSGIFGKLFNFDGGGFTGSGPRSGGMDGRGGFLAMMHPQETVIDHTKGQSAPAARSMVIHINPPAGMSRQSSSQFAADIARQLRMAEAMNG